MIIEFFTILWLSIPNICGSASWYHEGHTTANGEHYNPEGMTAAHRSLPFGTVLKVINPQNKKSVVVRINDRGPAKWTKRFIDLSRGSFRKIAPLKKGHTKVCIEILDNEK